MKNTNLLSTLFIAFISVALFIQCGEAKKGADNIANKTKEIVDDAANKTGEIAKNMSDKAGEVANDIQKTTEELTGMDSKEGSLDFGQDTWAYSVLQAVNTGKTTTFTLDEIPFEGEELTDAASEQLDNLASILKANPDWVIEVQGHTEKADNAIGSGKKKVTSKARAVWVQAKMNLRGITGKQISSTGLGDGNLLPELDPKDDQHKRITIALSKGAAAK